ncbi:MAG: methyltransferase domain-containing protein [Sphingomicrobium sp.]
MSGTGDAAFSGSVPEAYDRYLVPLMFEPYADDLARRAERLGPDNILEVAAGTGVVTRRLAEALPEARIAATDLNPDMLAFVRPLESARIAVAVADAQALPFGDDLFDLLVCQYGYMFVTDRPLAYREAARVLRPGGRILFNVWDNIADNDAANAVNMALTEAFPDDPPRFFERGPFSYHDHALIEAELDAAGFDDIAIERVELTSGLADPGGAIAGFVKGSPMAAELAERDQDVVAAAVERARQTIADRLRDGPLRMAALVVSAGIPKD